MDIQLKRGLLDICVLRALRNKDSYGYQIIKDISPYINITESTLYPILKRLENALCLEVYSVEHNSRLRKYYRITTEGFNKIEEFKAEWEEVMKVYDFIASVEDADSNKYTVNQAHDDNQAEDNNIEVNNAVDNNKEINNIADDSTEATNTEVSLNKEEINMVVNS